MAEPITRTQLISATEFKTLARPVSVHVDSADIDKWIRECEDMYIIPAIGWQNFKSATVTHVWDMTFDDTFNPDIFLSGGEWTDDSCGCGSSLKYCNGIKKSLAYFVYAKMLRNDGSIISRAGAMTHNDAYASHTGDTELKRYNDTMDVAERYLAETMNYCNRHTLTTGINVHGTRCRITAIGD